MNVTSSAFAEAGGGSDTTGLASLKPTGPSPLEYFSTYWVGASTWNIVTVMLMFGYFVAGCVAYFYFFWYLKYASKDKKGGYGDDADDGYSRKRSATSKTFVFPPLLKHSMEQILSFLENLD